MPQNSNMYSTYTYVYIYMEYIHPFNPHDQKTANIKVRSAYPIGSIFIPPHGQKTANV